MSETREQMAARLDEVARLLAEADGTAELIAVLRAVRGAGRLHQGQHRERAWGAALWAVPGSGGGIGA